MRAGTQKSLRSLSYAIIGAGMAGLLAGIKLRASGETNFTIYEKGACVGGTWRENRYPGLTCDVPAHAYTYSFAPYAEWDAFYATGAQIKEYFEKTADDYRLRSHLRFNTQVTACHFNEQEQCWHLTFANGETRKADIVIAASGVLHEPNLAQLEGLEAFAGKAFHSARWDDEAVLDDAKIGVIGNGSTGVQITSALSARAGKLVHFGRTPQWIMPVRQFAYTRADKARFRQSVEHIDAIRFDPEYWDNIRRFNKAITAPDGPEMAQIEALCLQNLERGIKDAGLRKKLRPNYRAACKRLIYSWNYYECVQRAGVEVATSGIDCVSRAGVRLVDGTFHELDVLILATGFRADRFIRPTCVMGRAGILLDDVWHVRASAHYAISVPFFPNFFMLNGPTGPVGNFSLIDIAEKQWDYIEQLLAPLRAGKARTIEVSLQAFDAYETRRIKAARRTIFASGCTSWYLDKTGIAMTWPWSYDAFTRAMRTPVLAEYTLA